MDLGQGEHDTTLLPIRLDQKHRQKNPGGPRLPAGSPTSRLTLHSGHFSFSFLAMPVMVPPVPDPITTMWTLPAGQGRERLAGTQHGLHHGLPSIQDPAQMQSSCPVSLGC